VTFNYQDPDASTPRPEVTDEDGRLARRRAELRTGEAATSVARAAADDLLAELPPERRDRPRSS
jgi:hypothetical protein